MKRTAAILMTLFFAAVMTMNQAALAKGGAESGGALTGDPNRITLYAVILIVCAVVIVASIVIQILKKRK